MNTLADWNQQWRAPLRESLDWLRDEINPHFENICGKYLKDPWEARNEFINLVLKSEPEIEKQFFADHQAKRLTAAARGQVLALLHMQRHMMMMYSSCGWFFDDISGVEATILLQHAGWVIKQSQILLKTDLLGGFLDRIRPAQSNDPDAGDGASVFAHACPELSHPRS